MISFYIDDAVSRGKTLGVRLLSHNGRYRSGVVTSVLIGTNCHFLGPIASTQYDEDCDNRFA